MRTSLSFSSSSLTVSCAKPAMSPMNFLRESSPRSILPQPLLPAAGQAREVSACSFSSLITFKPFSVATSARPSRST